MRKTVTGLAAVAAAVLLAGCGGGADGDAAGKRDGAAEASAQQADGGRSEGAEGAEGTGGSGGSGEGGTGGDRGSGGSGTGGGGAGGGEVTRTVTLEVDGEGKTQIHYTAGTDATEQATLPWSKTVELSLTEAERKAGVPVTIVPGTVMGDNGEFTAASCVIKVDGKKVDDNGNGKDISGCAYRVR